ncbi:DUF350 domain-containing protein [soil metagenome]
MFDSAVFREGALNFLIGFVAAGVFAVVFKMIYSVVTPFHEGKLIKEGNTAAALAQWASVLGYVLPLASALAHTADLIEFAAWAALSAVIQIVAFVAVRQLALPDVKARIEANDMSAAVYLAGLSLTVGLINAACITS